MAYTKTNWQNLPNQTTPLNASNMNKIEDELKLLDDNISVVTTETKIGTFKGKNLYRTIVEYTQASATSGSGLVQTDIPTGISTVKRVVSIRGSYDSSHDGTYNTILPNFTSSGDGSLSVNALLISSSSIQLRLRAYNHAISANTEFEFIVEYTKD